jgi:hypothetical protein
MEMFCEEEFGVWREAEVSDVTARDSGVLKGGAMGRRLVNSIASVLLIFTRSFHFVKYL